MNHIVLFHLPERLLGRAGIGPSLQFEAENMIPLGPEETLGAELDKASPAHCLPTGAAVLLALQIVVTSLYLLFHFPLSHCQEHL